MAPRKTSSMPAPTHASPSTVSPVPIMCFQAVRRMRLACSPSRDVSAAPTAVRNRDPFTSRPAPSVRSTAPAPRRNTFVASVGKEQVDVHHDEDEQADPAQPEQVEPAGEARRRAEPAASPARAIIALARRRARETACDRLRADAEYLAAAREIRVATDGTAQP